MTRGEIIKKLSDYSQGNTYARMSIEERAIIDEAGPEWTLFLMGSGVYATSFPASSSPNINVMLISGYE